MSVRTSPAAGPYATFAAQMRPSAHVLRRVREHAGLNVDEMATLVHLTPEAIEALERGGPYVKQDVLERYAVALGMSTDAVLAGEEPGAVAMLFRSMRAHGTSLDVFAGSGLQDVLGLFVRAVRDMARLRDSLGETSRRLRWLDGIPARPLPTHAQLHEQAHRLAAELREFLGIAPDAPIESMRTLAGQLGIATLFVEIEDEQVGQRFDGAVLLDPDPAILVNLVSGGHKWWRTRMTIAHEICHLLHDREALDPSRPRKFFLLSPRTERGQAPPWQLTEHFDDVEARANSFAGELLAPSHAVRQLLGGQDPTRLEAIKRVGDHFMIGATVAINRLRDTFQLSAEQRAQMQSSARAASLAGRLATGLPGAHPDAVTTGVGLPGPEFEALVLRALARGVIDPVAARAHLGLRMSDPLPPGPALSPRQCEPLLTPVERARNAAESYLFRRAPAGDVCLAGVEATAAGWSARVVRLGGARPEALGDLDVARDFTVRDPSWIASLVSG